MVLDTSVLLHIAFEEEGWEASSAFLLTQPNRFVSAASVIEAQAVMSRDSSADGKLLLDTLLSELRTELVPLSIRQSELAREAYLKYGKGQGHKAQLNFGDVMAYALAKDYNEPLAFVGNDFNHTDLKVVKFPIE